MVFSKVVEDFLYFFLPKVKFGCLKLTKSPLSGQSPFWDSQKLSLPPRDFWDNPLPGLIPLTNPGPEEPIIPLTTSVYVTTSSPNLYV